MRRRLSLKKLLGTLAAAPLLLAGSALAQDAPPVTTVGTVFPYTGGGAEWGQVMQRSADLAAKQINEAAQQILGGPVIELVHEDSATSPSVGVDRARKLIDVDGAPVVIGTWSSGVATAIADAVTMPNDILHVVPVATSPLITYLPSDVNDMLFRTIGADDQQGIVAAMLARGELLDGVSYDTASIVYENSPYGQGLMDTFVQSFEARGGTVLTTVGIPTEPQPTYSGVIEELLEGDPDVVLPIIYPNTGGVLLAEMRDNYGYTSWQFVDAMRALDVVEAIGEDVVEGSYGTTPAADMDSEGYQRFADLYEEEYGHEPPLSFMDTTYDAAVVTGLAIASAVAAGDEITPQNLRDHLRRVAEAPGEAVFVGEIERALELLAAGEDIDYSGAASGIDFDENGQVITPVEVWQFTGGGIETVEMLGSEDIPLE